MYVCSSIDLRSVTTHAEAPVRLGTTFDAQLRDIAMPFSNIPFDKPCAACAWAAHVQVRRTEFCILGMRPSEKATKDAIEERLPKVRVVAVVGAVKLAVPAGVLVQRRHRSHQLGQRDERVGWEADSSRLFVRDAVAPVHAVGILRT